MRFDARVPMVALYALLVACGNGSHRPEPAPAVPSPAVQPQAAPPSAPSAPDPKAQPKPEPRDSGGSGSYPSQPAPIAAL